MLCAVVLVLEQQLNKSKFGIVSIGITGQYSEIEAAVWQNMKSV